MQNFELWPQNNFSQKKEKEKEKEKKRYLLQKILALKKIKSFFSAFIILNYNLKNFQFWSTKRFFRTNFHFSKDNFLFNFRFLFLIKKL